VFCELAGDAAVLAGDHVGGGERLERAQADVAQVSDRRRDQIKACRRRRGFDLSTRDRVAARPAGVRGFAVLFVVLGHAGYFRRRPVARHRDKFPFFFTTLTFAGQIRR
jgi:hypothetical protein